MQSTVANLASGTLPPSSASLFEGQRGVTSSEESVGLGVEKY